MRKRDHGTGVGIDARMISQPCGPDVDGTPSSSALHCFNIYIQSRPLNDWREGDEPPAPVFGVGAIFPVEQGVGGFDSAKFIERLRSENSDPFLVQSRKKSSQGFT